MNGAVLLAGPTASGKSALALRIARELNGVVVNADSMQVYAELRILTARPAQERAAPHRLYGHVAAQESYSVARWLADVEAALGEAAASGLVPVIVGGTGLYFKALTEGLAPVPEIPANIRRKWRELGGREGTAGLHRILAARDPAGAASLKSGDTTRVTRALEVLDATGKPLREWQRDHPARPLVAPGAAHRLVLLPDRTLLGERIAQRFSAMIAAGGIDEATRLAALDLDPKLPAMKALGVRPLLDHLAGRVSLTDAIALSIVETRQYAKRQMTWFRNQTPDWRVIADPGELDLADLDA